jgi:hypothetical protein
VKNGRNGAKNELATVFHRHVSVERAGYLTTTMATMSDDPHRHRARTDGHMGATSALRLDYENVGYE